MGDLLLVQLAVGSVVQEPQRHLDDQGVHVLVAVAQVLGRLACHPGPLLELGREVRGEHHRGALVDAVLGVVEDDLLEEVGLLLQMMLVVCHPPQHRIELLAGIAIASLRGLVCMTFEEGPGRSKGVICPLDEGRRIQGILRLDIVVELCIQRCGRVLCHILHPLHLPLQSQQHLGGPGERLGRLGRQLPRVDLVQLRLELLCIRDDPLGQVLGELQELTEHVVVAECREELVDELDVVDLGRHVAYGRQEAVNRDIGCGHVRHGEDTRGELLRILLELVLVRELEHGLHHGELVGPRRPGRERPGRSREAAEPERHASHDGGAVGSPGVGSGGGG
mmetsp:Transcript_92130/g.269589  ORF Transcript_92130/g.269589 Transcript_92130/m.269589 type:complete len:336 (+) Transcript_92130:161-1168(+)